MQLIKKKLEKELKMLREWEENGLSYIESAPEGTIVTIKNHNTYQYYRKTNETNAHGCYIKKKDRNLVKEILQKEYVKKSLPKIREQIKTIEHFLHLYNFEKIEKVYEDMPDAKRIYVKPYIIPMELYAKQWEDNKIREKDRLSKFIVNKHILTEDNGIWTEKGELVRSKSEKILADKFYKMGIPYVYECPLMLKGFGYIRPDFVVLNKCTREEYYWEHFGLMSNKEYCEKAVQKINQYIKNGIYPGNKLINTYESEKCVMDLKVVDEMIEKYLMH